MKHLIKSFILLAVFCISHEATAQNYNSAVGARLGTFFSASYKTFLSETNAIEGIVGFDRVGGASFGGVTVGGSTTFLVGAFYQIHNDISIEGEGFQWYYGFGGYVALGDATGIVPGGVIGLEYTLSESPVNFFIDAIPSLYIGNGGSDFQINGAIGARYILNR